MPHEIYLEVPPGEIGYIQAVFESYEGVGVIRTIDRKRAIIALLVAEDFMAAARAILDSLRKEIPLAETSRPADVSDDWLLKELATEQTET